MQENPIVRFGPYDFEPRNAQLRRDMCVVPLTRKACAVLQCLVAQPGQLVTKEALFAAVWPETVVSDNVLTNCIAELRQALGDEAKRPRFIATVHRQGYRFIAPLRPPALASSPASPALACASALGPRPLVAPLSAPPCLVGREAELAHLHHLYSQVLHGQRHVVFVTGEAGIGKTALVETFVQGLSHDPGLWIGHGQCIEQYGAGEAYLPLLEALDRLCRGPGGERLVALLAQYAPSWVVQLPALLSARALADLQHTLVGTTRARMLRELSVALDVVSAEHPLVLVLEDLHWSDPSTVEALAMLARRREPARLLVVGTYRAAEVVVRDHPLKTVKHELIARGQGVEVALSYLSQAAVDAYVTARVADHGAAAALAPLVYRRTDGHPFFMVQVTDYLAEARGPRLATPTALVALEQALPPGLRELIEAQLGRLSAEEQQVLEVGSVAGVEFAVASVAAGLQLSDATIEAVCERLARRGQFLEERGLETWPDGTVSGRYAFRHALYQDVLYQRLGHGWQARLHRQIGEWQERAYGERAREVAAELALHFTRGRDPARAVRYLQQAAANALQRFAYREAVTHLTTVSALLATLSDTPERTRQELALQLALGQTLFAIKGQGAAEVAQAYQRARVLCQQVEETAQLGPVLVGLRMWSTARAEHPVAHELSERLLHLAQHVQEPALLLEAHRSMGVTWFFQGELARARTHLEHGIALATASPAPVPPGDRPASAPWMPPVVGCHVYVALVLWALGAADQALRRGQEALGLAQALAYPVSEATVRYLLSILHVLRGEGPAAQQQAEVSRRLASEHDVADRTAQPRIQRAAALVLQGQTAAGIAELTAGLAAARASGDAVFLPYSLALLAEAYGHTGQPHAGLQVLAEAHALVEQSGERWWQAELHRLQGALLLQHEGANAAPAAACFQQALAVARSQQAKPLELRAAISLGRLWQQQGKRTEAYALLAAVYGWFTEGFDTADLQEAQALLATLAG